MRGDTYTEPRPSSERCWNLTCSAPLVAIATKDDPTCRRDWRRLFGSFAFLPPISDKLGMDEACWIGLSSRVGEQLFARGLLPKSFRDFCRMKLAMMRVSILSTKPLTVSTQLWACRAPSKMY